MYMLNSESETMSEATKADISVYVHNSETVSEAAKVDAGDIVRIFAPFS